MKLSLIQCCLAMIFVGVSLAHDVNAQDILTKKISFRIEKQDFESVLSDIERQANVKFTYRPKLFVKSQKITLNVSDEPLSEVLNKIFIPLNIKYKVINNQIVLSKLTAFTESNEANLPQSSSQVEEDLKVQVVIKGKITDEKGEALVGASVRLNNSQKGTSTDVEGKYNLEISESDKNGFLVVSFVGYITQKIAINGKNEINVNLRPSSQDLSEIVVIGYGSQKKQDITSAISAVKIGDISSRPIVDAVEAITGKAPGIQVLNASGSPGSDLSVRVRGIGSPNGGEPLYVVDGVITPNLKAINPNTIESINVLKDASAAGIYGAAGSTNGVVIVTTKQGSKGKPLTEVSFYTAIQRIVKKLPMLNNTDYLALQAEISGAPIKLPSYYDINTNNEWQDMIYRNAPLHGVNIGTSGGSENGKYYFGLGYLNQQGIIQNSNFERYSAKFSIEQNVAKYLKIGGSINYNRTNSKDISDNASANFGGVVTSALVTAKYVPIFYGPTSPYPGVYGTNSMVSGENPISLIYSSQNNSVGNNLLGNVFSEIALPFDLKFKSQFNVVQNNSKRDYFQDPFASLRAIPTGGDASSSYFETFRWGWDNTLSWRKAFQKHSFDVVIGTSALKENIASSLQTGQGFGSNVVTTLNAASTKKTISTGNYDWSTNSYFGRVSYAYNNRYLATATFRSDGSSRVGQNNRWGNFPAFSLGWKLSNEDFMKDVKWVENVKIRAGWGKTGNLPPYTLLYPSFSLLNAGATYPFNGGAAISGINPSNQLGNPNLKWESASQTNIGFDASFLKNRLTLTVDYYKKKVENLIFTQQLPQTTGGTLTALNLPGFNINQGIELALDANVIKKTDFEWNSNFNISFNSNKVEGIDDNISFQTGSVKVGGSNVDLYTQIIKNNYALGTFWGYKSSGVNPETGDLILGKNLEKIGNALPKYTFGFSNNFAYKNLSLSVLIDGTQGNDIYNGLRMETERMNEAINQSVTVLDRWKKPGDITNIPRVKSSNSLLISSHYIEDGSFVRFRNVTLGYDLNKSILKKIGVAAVKVYVTAQNLYTFTKYSGYYPEVNAYGQGTNNQAVNAGSGVSLLSLGIDRGTYPTAKTFTLGLNVQF